MEEHLKKRPKKTPFPKEKIDSLRDKAIKKITSLLLPDDKIIKIILIGSSVKNTFGRYRTPGFRGSLFSDFDFIVFVDDDFMIPDWLDKAPDARPFPKEKLNLAYRNKKFIDKKYDIEIFFIKKSDSSDKKTQELGEKAGIPITADSKNEHITIYTKIK